MSWLTYTSVRWLGQSISHCSRSSTFSCNGFVCCPPTLKDIWLTRAKVSSKLRLSPSGIAVTSLLLGQSAFFASGHSNSFASFDLTNGFNGIETSRAVAVAIQALLSNYFGPVWWSLSSLRLLVAWTEGRSVPTSSSSNTSTFFDNIGRADPGPTNRKPDYSNGSAHGVVEEDFDDEEHGKHSIDSHTETPHGAPQGVGLNTEANGHLSSFQTYDVASAKLSTDRLQGDVSTTQVRHARNGFVEHLILQTMFTATTSLWVVLVCIWKRNDPSIWTVLTPKCLNTILWAVFQQLMVNSILCTTVWLVVVT